MNSPEILIVGAGPVGLTAALAFRSLGHPVTVIEAESEDRIRPGSRAIFIHRASLEILEKIQPGLGHELAEHGLVFSTKRTFYRGDEIYRRTYALPETRKLPAATNLPQVVTEQLLYQACRKAEVAFLWNTPIRSALSSREGVQLKSENGKNFQAKYVVAADGSRSDVRESIGLHLEGPRTTNAYVIVDAKEDPKNPLPVERTFHYEHPAVEGRNVLFVPFAGHWRIDLQCHATDDPEQFSGMEGVKSWLPKVLRADYVDRITWVSTYIFRQAIANRFADVTRRILLVGEAAHIFAPFGARGLNSGIPDAFLAARAVHQALNTATPEDAARVIDHFAESRRLAALFNRKASNIALKHLTANSPVTRAVRRIASALAPSTPKIAQWMDQAPFGPKLRPPDRDGMQY